MELARLPQIELLNCLHCRKHCSWKIIRRDNWLAREKGPGYFRLSYSYIMDLLTFLLAILFSVQSAYRVYQAKFHGSYSFHVGHFYNAQRFFTFLLILQSWRTIDSCIRLLKTFQISIWCHVWIVWVTEFGIFLLMVVILDFDIYLSTCDA
jgi:hypothetical protein